MNELERIIHELNSRLERHLEQVREDREEWREVKEQAARLVQKLHELKDPSSRDR